MSRFIRCILSAFVLVCLTAGAAQALPARSAASVVPEAASVLDAAWSWLVGRFLPAEPPARQDGSRQQKTGCGMDPDGKPRSCSN